VKLRATFMQRRLYDVTERHPDQAMRHVTAAFEFSGRLDIDRLRAAALQLMVRHDALRMRFLLDEHDVLVAHVVEMDSRDVDTVMTVVESTEGLDDAIRLVMRHFDRADDAPWRLVVNRGSDKDTMILVFDHLVCDARSMRVVLDDLAALYNGASLPAEAPLFAEWLVDEVEQGSRVDREVAYWKARYAEVPRAYSIKLPFATGWRSRDLGTPAFEELWLDAGEVARMKHKASLFRLSPFGVALTSLNLVLAPHCDDRAVALTGVLPNRRDGIYDGAVGSFAHTTAYVTAIPAPDGGFESFAAATRSAVINTLRHSRLALFDLIGRLGVGDSLASVHGYGVYFDYLYEALDTSRFELGGLRGTEVRLDSGVNRSLSIWVVERDGGALLKANFEAERFSRTGVRQFLREFADAMTDTAGEADLVLSGPRDRSAAESAAARIDLMELPDGNRG